MNPLSFAALAMSGPTIGTQQNKATSTGKTQRQEARSKIKLQRKKKAEKGRLSRQKLREMLLALRKDS